jgi:hypothetical protein
MTRICECCGQPIKAARAKAPKAPTFKSYDDWAPAHLAAKLAACADLGVHWAIQPGASVIARVPAAWVACKVFARVSKSPRDVRMPAARFWPNGLLPRGPEYAVEYRREPELTREEMAEWLTANKPAGSAAHGAASAIAAAQPVEFAEAA